MKPKHIILALSFCLIILGAIYACTTANGSEGPEQIPSTPGAISSLEEVVIPTDMPGQIKNYEGFTVCFNRDNGTPNYVVWELLAEETTGDVPRSDFFWQDTEIVGCPTYRDYKGSGYDRGHMCPAADQKWSEKAMNDCFSMANMCPQDHALNSGAWATLESKERTWAMRDSNLIIVAGPIYSESDTKRIGDSGVRVPGAFFKVFLAPNVDKPRAIGFIYPNMTSPGNMSLYACSVDDVEKATGFDFFSALPDDIEQEIEANYSFNEWNSKKKSSKSRR